MNKKNSFPSDDKCLCHPGELDVCHAAYYRINLRPGKYRASIANTETDTDTDSHNDTDTSTDIDTDATNFWHLMLLILYSV